MSTCKSCGAEIVWIRMKSGKMMPCDALGVAYDPDDNGTLTLITPDGEIVKGNPSQDFKHCKWGYCSHFATCPNADQHRRRGND